MSFTSLWDPNLNPALKDIMRICTLAGGLQFHKTMKRLCLSVLIPSVTAVILIIFFNLSHPAIIQCKLTGARNILCVSGSVHVRQENDWKEHQLWKVLRWVHSFLHRFYLIFSEIKSHWDVFFLLRQAFWHIDQAVPFAVFLFFV